MAARRSGRRSTCFIAGMPVGWPAFCAAARQPSATGALCRAHGIEPVVFSSPNFRVQSPEHIRTAPARLMAAEGLTLFDFNDSLDAEANFNDNRHLNRTGGARFTQLLMDQVICR